MANPFQSSPSYGPPYGSGPGSYYPQYQQYGAQQPAHSPSSYSPHAMPPMAGYQPSPNANIARFDANSQMPPSQRFAFPPAPFPPDMLKQFANATVPPPPFPGFPPVPIPNLGVPQFPQAVSHTNTPPFPPSVGDNHAEDPDAYDPRYPQNIMSSRQPDRPVFGSHSLYPPAVQQGEPPEDDSPASRTISHEDHLSHAAGNPNAMSHPPNLDGSVFSSQNIPILPGADIASSHEPAPVDLSLTQAAVSQIQGVDHKQLKPSSPVAVNTPKSANPFQPRHDGHYQPPSNSKPFQRHYENKTVAELRQLAKGALLSLAPHSIHYVDLVKEGIDSRTLALLYEELGIKVSTGNANEQLNDVSASLSQPDETVPAPTAAIPPTQLQVPTSAPSFTNALNRPGPAISPSLERKDRIAQLLAAKAGHPSPARSASDSVASAGPLEATQPVAVADDIDKVSDMAARNDTGARTPEFATTLTSSTQAETLKESLDLLQDEPQIKIQLERRSTDRGPLPSPFSSSIPGLFMTADDRMQLESARARRALPSFAHSLRAASTSQKRRRSSDEADEDFQPDQKRQNTTSDLDEGEVMVIDSPSNDEGSEGEIPDDEPRAVATRRMQDASMNRGAQLQRSQSAAELPVVTPSVQQSSISIVSGPTSTTLPKPFGGTAVAGMTAAQISERAEMLKARFLKQRAERQKALQDGLPNLNAEVSKTQALLAERHNTMQQFDERIRGLNVELKSITDQKQAVVEEVSRLERQLQEGISGQRQYNDELQKLSTEQNASATAGRTKPTSAPYAGEEIMVIDTPADIPSNPAMGETTFHASSGDNESVSNHVAAGETTKQHEAMALSRQQSLQGGPDLGQAPAISEAEVADVRTADNDHSDGIGMPSDNDAKDHAESGNIENEALVESQPESIASPNSTTKVDLQDGMKDRVEIDKDDSDGSASMSDSGSEGTEDEYEPADPASAYPMEIDDNASDEYDPEEAPVDPTPPSGQIEGREEYEPVESMAAEDVAQTAGAVLNEPINGQAPAVRYGSEPQVNHPSTPSDQVDGSSHAPRQHRGPSNAFQRRSASTMGIVRPLSNEGAVRKVDFAPYQSPLSSLKSFRYNEQFNESAKEGFRSLTYSNTIDPNVPLCQTELSGGVCQDPQCEEQHFRKFQLSDDQILVQMSSTSDIGDKETRDLFTKGLKELIADLRTRNVKEFENVANELSNYRRRFFNTTEAA